MNIQRTGIILNTEYYEACLAFYRDLFELPLLFEERDGDFRLACLGFGDGYLMIETGGKAAVKGKAVEACPHKLRFNVADLDQALAKVRACGIEAEIQAFDWGSTINFHDPDGNRIGIRDEAGFRRQ